MKTTELEAKIKRLEEKIAALEDIDEIKALQRIYGYYLDNRMIDDIMDLFSDNTEYIEVTDEGIFMGKEGVRKFYIGGLEKPLKDVKGSFGMHLQLQGTVNLDPGGKTAHGRWQLLGLITIPTAPNENHAIWSASVYENEYIKEDGKWKFKKITLHPYFVTTFEDGWAKLPYVNFFSKEDRIMPDIPAIEDKTYPTGYLLPCHFKNPVTGN